ncbi:MAG TPA: AAA family ATPase [Actinomycetota bacterium]|nr:AAA family ATPase [Actinomycetota bacterium]
MTDSRLITIASATGGCGKTFFATNAAADLAARTDGGVLLMDLDLQFGEVAVALQMRPQHSIIDGLFGRDRQPLPPETTEAVFDELVTQHSAGFDVLSAPSDPADADLVGEGEIRRILDIATARYAIVIVDTPPALTEVVLEVLDRSDVIIVMASLDVPSLKNLSVYLRTLQRLDVADDRIGLVLNKVESDVGIDVDQAQELFDGRFAGVISHDRAVSRTINLGTVLVDAQPRMKVARQVSQSIRALLPDAIAAAETERVARSVARATGSWRRRGSTMRATATEVSHETV